MVERMVRQSIDGDSWRTPHARILHIGRPIWPAAGWAEIPPDSAREIAHRVDGFRVAKGDQLRFVIKQSGADWADPVIWDPSVIFSTEGRRP